MVIKTTLYNSHIPNNTNAIRFISKLEEGGKIISFLSEEDRDFVFEQFQNLELDRDYFKSECGVLAERIDDSESCALDRDTLT